MIFRYKNTFFPISPAICVEFIVYSQILRIFAPQFRQKGVGNSQSQCQSH